MVGEQVDKVIERLRHMDPLAFEISNNIYAARKQRKITQLQLAKKAGTNSVTIFVIERSCIGLSIRLLIRLAFALRVSIFELAPPSWFARQLPRDVRRTRQYVGLYVQRLVIGFQLARVERVLKRRALSRLGSQWTRR
jgi:transcriptional regulator with XRE-family HTH domain